MPTTTTTTTTPMTTKKAVLMVLLMLQACLTYYSVGITAAALESTNYNSNGNNHQQQKATSSISFAETWRNNVLLGGGGKRRINDEGGISRLLRRRRSGGGGGLEDNRRRRKLQGDRGGVSLLYCNEELGRIPKDLLLQVASIYLISLQEQEGGVTPEDAAAAFSTLTSNVKYGVSIRKVCGSCEELFPPTENTNLPSVCDSGAYGSDALHSALVTLPVDPTTGEIVQGGLRGVLSFHGLKINVDDAPSTNFVVNFPTLLEEVSSMEGGTSILESEAGQSLAFMLLEANSIAAGAGSVVIRPDYLGYGASLPTHNRTFGILESYQQAAVVTWLTTQNYLAEMSGGCTALDDVVTIEGSSEGGFGAIAASLIMQQLTPNMRILKVLTNAPFLDHQVTATHLIKSYDEQLISPERSNSLAQVVLPLAGFVFSIELPGLANTGSGQIVLSRNWTVPDNFDRNIIAWLESPNPITGTEILSLMPDAPDVMNENFLQLIREAIAVNSTLPCTVADNLAERNIDKLCEALGQNDLTPYLAKVDFPLDICFSVDDTLLTSSQITDNSIVDDNEHITLLPVSGDHPDAIGACIISNVVPYLLTGATNGAPASSPEDLPFLVTPLGFPPPQVCVSSNASDTTTAATTTTVPTTPTIATSTPTMAPVSTGSATTTTAPTAPPPVETSTPTMAPVSTGSPTTTDDNNDSTSSGPSEDESDSVVAGGEATSSATVPAMRTWIILLSACATATVLWLS